MRPRAYEYTRVNALAMLIVTVASNLIVSDALFSSIVPRTLRQRSHQRWTRNFGKTSTLFLNRFLFDPSEIDTCIESDPHSSTNSSPIVTLPKNDYRTIHAAKVLGLLNGDNLRAGIVQDNDIKFNSTSQLSIRAEYSEYAGLVTDEAEIQWIPEGKIKKAEPTKNGDPPGSLQIALNSLTPIDTTDLKPRVSLILALPRPLALARLLPMIAQMGVQDLILTQAQKVPKDYFGSHLFRKPIGIRNALIEGLCQAADVQIPSVTIVKRLKPFLEDDLDSMFPKETWARVIAHPQRKGGERALRMGKISFSDHLKDSSKKRIVLAVGPEGGWAEPYELDMFQNLGFQQVTLGPRILRSDVAVVSLLSLAQDVCVT